VQAMAQHLADSGDSEAFIGRFSRRLSALAASNNLLVSGKWQGVEIGKLVNSQLMPFIGAAGRVTLSGPALRLKPAATQALGMALHELATNAAKYGALSIAGGHVSITSRVDDGVVPCLRIAWDEHGGPAVHTPTRRGFGMRLIEEALVYEADGWVALRFPGHGLRCEIEIPVPPPS